MVPENATLESVTPKVEVVRGLTPQSDDIHCDRADL